jgi:hypothetical protein
MFCSDLSLLCLLIEHGKEVKVNIRQYLIISYFLKSKKAQHPHTVIKIVDRIESTHFTGTNILIEERRYVSGILIIHALLSRNASAFQQLRDDRCISVPFCHSAASSLVVAESYFLLKKMGRRNTSTFAEGTR